MAEPATIQKAELFRISELKPHPRNYRAHPQSQIDHLRHSIREFGFYRNVVLARDLTILAGHGIVEASKQEGIEEVPGVRLDISPESALALKLLAGDNYLSYFAEDDDRALTDLLKELANSDISLLGTGFDQQQLAALAMITRPAHELADFDAAAEWAGMPDYEPAEKKLQLVLICWTEEDRNDLIEKLGITISSKIRQVWSAWWPPQAKDDSSSIMFDS